MIRIVPYFYGIVSQGVLRFTNPELVRGHLLNFEGKEVQVTIARKYKRRSSGKQWEDANANGYYWKIIVSMIADEIGELDKDLVHTWIQIGVGNITYMPDGNAVPCGTRRMTTSEFESYCEKARIWASMPGAVTEEGIYIPAPHEVAPTWN